MHERLSAPKGASASEKSLSVSRSPAWLRYAAIALLVAGIFFRFVNLGEKIYWLDEMHTSLRMSGHTEQEFIEEVTTGEVLRAGDLQQYQRPGSEKSWGDTMQALQGNPEHTPLYFLMARAWTELFGHSPATIRSLSALISILVFPGLFWLCRELFQSSVVGWIAVALVAVSPLHVLYAQEARPYSLWTLMIVLSSAVLLWAMRSQSRLRWALYGLSVSVGLYSQLLFGLVAIAHGLYVAAVEWVGKWRFNRTIISYLVAAGAALVSFIPWLMVFFTRLDRVEDTTSSLRETITVSTLINKSFLNMSRVLLDRELGGANFVMVLLAAVAVIYLCRKAPPRAWKFLLLLGGVSLLALLVPDLILGGVRSIRLRYLFPFYLSIQIALAYLFATQAVWARTWGQKFWRLVMVILITGGVMAGVANINNVLPWTKSAARSAYYPDVSAIVNQANQAGNPLIISNGDMAEILAFSYWLDPDVNLQLITRPRLLEIAPGYDPVYLLNPSAVLRRILTEQGYDLSLVYKEPEDMYKPKERLWLVN
ncbi:MAG: hypothetical protein Kow00121_08330 [Elainellaceae cyanobacterium]